MWHPQAVLFGLLLVSPLLVAWADSWEALRDASRTVTSVEARFVQKKTLPILAKPFVSGGRFFFQKPGSLRWEYDRPVRSVLLMHAGSVRRYLRDKDVWREEGGAPLTAMQTVLGEIVNWQQGRFDANPHFQASLERGSRNPGDPRPEGALLEEDDPADRTHPFARPGGCHEERPGGGGRAQLHRARIRSGKNQPAPAGCTLREGGMN